MNLLYRKLRHEDIPSILEISSLQLGPSYLNEKHLLELINESDTNIEVLLVEGRIVGYSIIHMTEKLHLYKYLDSGYSNLMESIDPKTRIQLRKTTAIHPDYTGKGLGTNFIRHTMKLYMDESDLIMSINWKRGKDIPMAKISADLGMEEFVELKNFWKKESLE